MSRPPCPLRVLVVAGDPESAGGLAQALSGHATMELAARADSVDAGMQLVLVRLPDVVLLRWGPGAAGMLHTLRAVFGAPFLSRVVLVLTHQDACDTAANPDVLMCVRVGSDTPAPTLVLQVLAAGRREPSMV